VAGGRALRRPALIVRQVTGWPASCADAKMGHTAGSVEPDLAVLVNVGADG
jgi:hypothetical protein